MKKPKGLLLLSGGIDSPVAGYLMKKQGVEVLAVHFSNKAFTGKEPEQKSKKLAENFGFRFFSVDISKGLSEISKKCEKRFYFVLSKRLMFRLAEKLAKKEKCDFLITGENLGQVSSQTLENLAVIDSAVEIPVLRPLLTKDKVEIVNLAKSIGSFDISKGPEYCDIFGPEHPSTKAKEKDILSEEEKLKKLKLFL